TLHFALPPGIEPREYQLEAVARARVAVGTKGTDGALGRPCVVMPTGAGKTAVGSILAASAVGKGSRVLWIAHRRELCLQARERLESFGLRVGMILADEAPDAGAPVQVAGVLSLARRGFPPAEVVVIDEAHRGRAASYEKLVSHYRDAGAAVLGLTATPMRGDGRGLHPVFTSIVSTVTGDELRAQGILVPARVFAP